MKRRNTLLALVGVLLCAGAPTASAGPSESFWISPGGDFEDPANWNGPVPDDTVTAVFEIEAPGPFVFFNDCFDLGM